MGGEEGGLETQPLALPGLPGRKRVWNRRGMERNLRSLETSGNDPRKTSAATPPSWARLSEMTRPRCGSHTEPCVNFFLRFLFWRRRHFANTDGNQAQLLGSRRRVSSLDVRTFGGIPSFRRCLQTVSTSSGRTLRANQSSSRRRELLGRRERGGVIVARLTWRSARR